MDTVPTILKTAGTPAPFIGALGLASVRREILTYPQNQAVIRNELIYLIAQLEDAGIQQCQVLFGFAWGNRYYSSERWEAKEWPVTQLMVEVERVESLNLGTLGQDDLFITVSGLPLEFHYCHESDIHIYFDHPHEWIERFYSRWKVHHFRPAEWIKSDETGEKERIRFE